MNLTDFDDKTPVSRRLDESHSRHPASDNHRAVRALKRAQTLINERLDSNDESDLAELYEIERKLMRHVDEDATPELTQGANKIATATGQQGKGAILSKAMQNTAAGKMLNPAEKEAMAKSVKGLAGLMQDPATASKLQQMMKSNAVMEAAESHRSHVTRFGLLEATEIMQAEVILAAQNIVDQVQKMIEMASNMQYRDLPALTYSIRNGSGTSAATQYSKDVGTALANLINSLQETKTALESSQGVLTGDESMQNMTSSSKAGSDPEFDVFSDPGEETGIEPDDNADNADRGPSTSGKSSPKITAFGRDRR